MNINTSSKILVTGGTGFVGSHILLELIRLGYKNITAIKRISSTIPAGLTAGIDWIDGDIMDVPLTYEQVAGVDAIIHAAAEVGFSMRKRDKVIASSRDGTATLVNAALEADIKKFVYVSSVAAIGRQKLEETIDELKVFSHSAFDTSYGLAKFLGEQEVWRGQAEGLTVAIINPSLILGESNFDRSSQKIFTKIAGGKMPYYPVGTTGWVDVKDVAMAAIKCLDDQIQGQRYIISSQNLSYQDVFKYIASKLNTNFEAKPLTPWVGKLAYIVESFKSWLTGKDPILTKETLQSMSCHSMYQNTKSTAQLGIEYTDIYQTIDSACQKYHKNS